MFHRSCRCQQPGHPHRPVEHRRPHRRPPRRQANPRRQLHLATHGLRRLHHSTSASGIRPQHPLQQLAHRPTPESTAECHRTRPGRARIDRRDRLHDQRLHAPQHLPRHTQELHLRVIRQPHHHVGAQQRVQISGRLTEHLHRGCHTRKSTRGHRHSLPDKASSEQYFGTHTRSATPPQARRIPAFPHVRQIVPHGSPGRRVPGAESVHRPPQHTGTEVDRSPSTPPRRVISIHALSI